VELVEPESAVMKAGWPRLGRGLLYQAKWYGKVIRQDQILDVIKHRLYLTEYYLDLWIGSG
jgi:hypothetical protein